MKRPEIVIATPAQIDALLALAKPTFPPGQYDLLEAVLGSFANVMRALQDAKSSMKRFRNMLFGASTERKDKVLKNDGTRAADAAPAAGEPRSAEAESAAKPSPPRAGHGRNAAQAYRDAPVVTVEVADLKPGDPCPECGDGKVYDAPPKRIVKVRGQAPLAATVYQLQQLRCRMCDARFSAALPEGTSPTKYDHACASMLALVRYGSGMPFYRIEALQGTLNVPLPDATQWEIVSKPIAGPRAAFEELIRQAAQAPLLHNDDTPALVLALKHARAKAEVAGQTPVAKAINTSGIVALLQEHKVVLFFTGHAHAGQNLARVLAQRANALAAPIQMCDALACNFSGEFATVLSHCLAHARRRFVDVLEHFPAACRHVIEVLAKVYANDAHCREAKLSPEQRLVHHQENSGAPMQALHAWMNEQFEARQAEPNSGLGRALRYMLKHWSALTLFLHKAGAPLDNNVCERVLKRAILQRKNSMFYKTPHGAEVGDIYMSLIHTCQLNHVNAFEYLNALQKHAEQVQAHAALWMPWNYREQLARTA